MGNLMAFPVPPLPPLKRLPESRLLGTREKNSIIFSWTLFIMIAKLLSFPVQMQYSI
jgi:hypothetical protein